MSFLLSLGLMVGGTGVTLGHDAGQQAQESNTNEDGDSGKLGLVGLAGLARRDRRDDYDRNRNTGTQR